MRNAEPAELRLGAGGRIARPSPGALTPASAGSEPPARSAVDASATPTAFPDRVHGKVFFTISGGTVPGDFVCSGTVVSSNGHTLAWTAGHCVNDAEFGGGFATNWTFVPGYRNGERPFGTWVAEDLMTTRGWADNVNIRLDVGAALLERDGEGRGIEDVIGARGIAFNRTREQQFTAFGYPAQPSLLQPEFDGQRLYSVRLAADRERRPARQRAGDDRDRLRHDRRLQRRWLGDRRRSGQPADQLRLHRRLRPPLRPLLRHDRRGPLRARRAASRSPAPAPR